jgi:hypothetical protein
MVSMPTTLYLDKSHLKGVVEAVQSCKGHLIVLAGANNSLQLSWFVMEDVKIQLRAAGVTFTEMTKVGTGPVSVPADCSGKVVVFDELRLQQGHEYSAQLAAQYITAGATVLAVVNGADKDAVANRLFMLGMPKPIISDKLKVMDYFSKIA